MSRFVDTARASVAHDALLVASAQMQPFTYPNLINTPLLASDLGIRVAEQVQVDAHKDYESLITVEVFSDETTSRQLSATCVTTPLLVCTSP